MSGDHLLELPSLFRVSSANGRGHLEIPVVKWRLAFCGATDDLEEISALVRAACAFVYRQRGIALFAIASHLEDGLIQLLAQQGFLRRRERLPFHVMRGRKPGLPPDEFAALSFLDTDMAYRFE